MNRQESRGNISSVQAHWSSRAVNYSIGSCFWLVGYEIGIASSYQARAHGTTVKYSAHIIISIYSNCTKDKGSLIAAYIHFLSKTTELKKRRDLESLADSRRSVSKTERNKWTARSKTARDRPTPPPFFLLSCYHRIIYHYALHLSGNVRETISGLIQENTLNAGNSNLHCTSRYQSIYFLFRDKAQFTWR